MLLNCGVGEDSWESLGLQGDRTSPSSRKSVLNIIGRTDRLSGNSNTLATWCEELSRWKRLWCWERLKVGRQGDKKGWDCWMVSLAQWIWVWVNSGSCWWTGRPGVLQSMGLQRVRHDWATDLIWFTTAKIRPQSQRPSTYEWIKDVIYNGVYSAMRKEDIFTYTQILGTLC